MAPLPRGSGFGKPRQRAPVQQAGLNKPGFLELGVSPEQAPDEPTYITLHFEKGVPTQLDGETLTGVEMVSKLNELGGKNGIGLADIIENRLVGMKSRGVYETPGGTILYHAHNKPSTRLPAAPSSTTPTTSWRSCAWIRRPITTSSRLP